MSLYICFVRQVICLNIFCVSKSQVVFPILKEKCSRFEKNSQLWILVNLDSYLCFTTQGSKCVQIWEICIPSPCFRREHLMIKYNMLDFIPTI